MEYIEKFFDQTASQLVISIGVLFLFIIVRKVFLNIVKRHAEKGKIAYSRQVYMQKLVGIIITLVFITVIGLVWEISLIGLSLYFASLLTVLGVALFANWSILSNLTASIVLFFFFPYRIGSMVRIIDGDNSIEGEILDITFFYMKVKTTENKLVSFPNNLAIQKAMELK